MVEQFIEFVINNFVPPLVAFTILKVFSSSTRFSFIAEFIQSIFNFSDSRLQSRLLEDLKLIERLHSSFSQKTIACLYPDKFRTNSENSISAEIENYCLEDIRQVINLIHIKQKKKDHRLSKVASFLKIIAIIYISIVSLCGMLENFPKLPFYSYINCLYSFIQTNAILIYTFYLLLPLSAGLLNLLAYKLDDSYQIDA